MTASRGGPWARHEGDRQQAILPTRGAEDDPPNSIFKQLASLSSCWNPRKRRGRGTRKEIRGFSLTPAGLLAPRGTGRGTSRTDAASLTLLSQSLRPACRILNRSPKHSQMGKAKEQSALPPHERPQLFLVRRGSEGEMWDEKCRTKSANTKEKMKPR